MVLIKCKCGCFYTLNQIGLDPHKDLDRQCPNCGTSHQLSGYKSLDTMLPRAGDAIEIEVIPDNVKIHIGFDL